MYQECSLGYNKTYRQVIDNFLPNLADFYKRPSAYRVEPFRIFGNLDYVGDRKVCMHLVDTGDGLLLFDTGYRNTSHMLVQSIYDLGFDPHDIKLIIHSHGHFDHFGSGNEFRALYGAQVAMSRVDTELLREDPRRALMHLSPAPDDEICWPDIEIDDGDVLTLGSTRVRCLLSPGHTMGTMAFFFDAVDGEETKKVAYLGGVGFLSVYKEYCREYGLPENKTELLKTSIEKLRGEKADIFLGNHPNHNCTLEKRQWMIEHPGSDPFINPEGWSIFLDALEARRADFERLGY